MKNYLDINRESWNTRVSAHLESAFYDVEGFLKNANSLKKIELTLLPDLKGKSLLHLQCHFGQDTISLAQMGAEATGVDFSEKAIDAARNLAISCKSTAQFICSDVYSLPEMHKQKYDIVFSSYGTIGWLPDIKKWAEVVSVFLKPGGTFVFAEFHPLVRMFDNDQRNIAYRYFRDEAIVETDTGTYASKNGETYRSVTWNHGLAEVLDALIRSGLEIQTISEHDYSPYNCFENMEESEPGKFRIKHWGNKLPMVYSLKAIKK